MSKHLNGCSLTCLVLLAAVTLAYAGDNQSERQSKVTATTVTTSRPNVKAILSVYEPSQPYQHQLQHQHQNQHHQSNAYQSERTGDLIEPTKSDVSYSEPDLIERRTSKIDLVKKDDQQQLNLYKRPSQFSELLRNPELLEKQKAALGLASGRLNAKLMNDAPVSEEAIRRRFGDDRGRPSDDRTSLTDQKKPLTAAEKELKARHELNNQFAQALNYLIKYVNRQGQTRSTNGTEHKKRQDSLLLKHARNLDRENCLLRLICEISSNHEDASDSQLIREIRVVFGNSRQAPAYPTKRDPSFPFYYAGHVGAVSNRAERCLEIFPVCSARTDELLAIVSNASKYAARPSKLAMKSDKMRTNGKLESELSRTAESREFSEKMRNKMKRLHKEYVKKLN